VKVLALDSSGPVVILGVADGRKILVESQFLAGSKTVGLLTPEIERILSAAGVRPTELDGFALGAGPGSFTGLKVSFAAIMGLAFNGDKPVWTYPSLKLTALGLALSAEFKKGLSATGAREKQPAFRPDSGGMNLRFGKGSAAAWEEKPAMNKILVLTGAKKGYFYRGMFAWIESGVDEVEPLQAQKIEELVWPAEPVWVTGSAWETERSAVMERVRPQDQVASKDFWHPPAGLLAQLAATGKLGAAVEKDAALEPIFLKSFETRFKEMA
jgi:tRNA threonylcarbamoyl adenosine modification protein YeaZ